MNKLAVPLIQWQHDGGLTTLLQTEVILPAQFWNHLLPDSPERRLLLAILEDALLTLLQHRRRDNAESRRLVIETEKWIASNRRTSAFDFVGLCDVLGVDPTYLRALVRRPEQRMRLTQRRRSHAGRSHHKVRTPRQR